MLRDDLVGELEDFPNVCTFGLELPASKSGREDSDSLRRTVVMTSSKVGRASMGSESADFIRMAALWKTSQACGPFNPSLELKLLKPEPAVDGLRTGEVSEDVAVEGLDLSA